MAASLEAIRHALQSLEPANIDLTDDSHLHAGHAGAQSGGGHYRLRIVSAHFVGLNRLARQRLVYDALHALMQREIHALSMQTLTPAEANNP